MGRLTKQGIDYFSIDVQFDDKTELYLIEKEGIGLAVLITLWQLIYQNEGYYIKASDDIALLIKRRINVDINAINACIKTALKRGIFDANSYEKYNILTSKAIQKRYFDAAKRKKEVNVIKEIVLVSLTDYKNIINVNINGINVDINRVNVKKLNINSKNAYKNATKEKEKEYIYTTKLKKFVGNYINYIKKTYPTKSPKGNNVKNNSLEVLDKLIRIDGFKEEYIFESIRWGQENDFWKVQIYSLAGLRNKSQNGLTKFQNLSNSFDKDKPEQAKIKIPVFEVAAGDR